MIIHVHQQRLRQDLPALILRTAPNGKHLGYHTRIKFDSGAVVQPGRQLACGARAWIEVDNARCDCPPETHDPSLTP